MKVLLNRSITLNNTPSGSRDTHISYKKGDIVGLPTTTANSLIEQYRAIPISGVTSGKTRVRALKSFVYTKTDGTVIQIEKNLIFDIDTTTATKLIANKVVENF